MSRLSRRERVLVGVGLAAALVVGGHGLILEPLLAQGRAASAAVLVREAALERRRLLVGQRARLDQELAAAEARLAAESTRLLRGPTAPLAAAELQRLVKDLLPAVGVEVRSERVLTAADQDGLLEVGIELTLVGSIRDTVAALARLEHAAHLLALKDVKMRVVAAGQPRDLLTTVIVAGYLLPDPR